MHFSISVFIVVYIATPNIFPPPNALLCIKRFDFQRFYAVLFIHISTLFTKKEKRTKKERKTTTTAMEFSQALGMEFILAFWAKAI